MSQQLIEIVEGAYLKTETPEIHIGDTVDVKCRILEGEKERIQIFNGTLIARKGRGINSTITVRRTIGREGVERIFMIHSPNVVNVTVCRRGKVRRAKLYYLRDRVGNARKVRELRVHHHKNTAKESAALAEATA